MDGLKRSRAQDLINSSICMSWKAPSSDSIEPCHNPNTFYTASEYGPRRYQANYESKLTTAVFSIVPAYRRQSGPWYPKNHTKGSKSILLACRRRFWIISDQRSGKDVCLSTDLNPGEFSSRLASTNKNGYINSTPGIGRSAARDGQDARHLLNSSDWGCKPIVRSGLLGMGVFQESTSESREIS